MQARTQPSLSRDFAILSVFILFILVMVCIWVTVETLHNYERDVQKQFESEALRLDRGLIVEIETAAYILESLGRQIQTTGDKPENIAQLFVSFSKGRGQAAGIFSWVNKAQSIIVSNNFGVLDTPIDVADRDYVKKSVAEPWKIQIGSPIEGRLSQKWVLPISLGVTDKNGTYVGSVVIALDTNRLAEEISRSVREKESGLHFAITNLGLTLLTRRPDSSAFFSKYFNLSELAKIDFQTAESGFYSKASLWDSGAIYAYYERSSQYPYVLFLGLDAAKSRTVIYSLLSPRLFQLLVIAVFLLFVLWTVRKRIIHPVVRLTQETAQIVRGGAYAFHGDFGPLEVEQLAHEIKRLYEYLQERRRIESEMQLKIVELSRFREAAQLTNQVKADFFAEVGRELREPAELIVAQIETIKDQLFGPVGSPKYLASATEVSAQAQQLMGMLGEIEAISRAETGLLALKETEVDLPFLLQKAVRVFKDRAPRQEVVLEIAPDLPRLVCDELRVKQLVIQLLSMASQQVLEGDTIRVAASLKNREMQLLISYAPQSEPGRGRMTLGMALCRLLVALHQGQLESKTNAERVALVVVKFPAIRVV